MSEREIKFKDIRVGDTIRTVKFVCDLKISYEGLVAKLTDDFANTAEAMSIAGASWDDSTYILVNRPTPKLPTEPGAVIIATKVRGVEGKWRMMRDWCGLWLSPERILRDQWHRDYDIQEWRPAEVFEVTP